MADDMDFDCGAVIEGEASVTELGEALYRKRKQIVEPVFGHTKHNRGFERFHRRGRSAVRTEWRLILMTHNLTKLHNHRLAIARA